MNGFCANEGNATKNQQFNKDMWSTDQNEHVHAGGKKARKSKAAEGLENLELEGQKNPKDSKDTKDPRDLELEHEFVFRESSNVSHSDTILDMAVLEVESYLNSGMSQF